MTDAPVRVLLVEDDEDDAVLTAALLSDIDGPRFELDWVGDFDEGLARLRAMPYDVCLVDYRLGRRDGVQFLREAIEQGCPVPIIVLTGQGDHAVDLAAMKAGAADFLNKEQITADLLERSIRYSIQQKRTEEQRVRLLLEQAARAEAESANRAKDQFLATLSHELRTPLTPVLMAVETIAQDPDLPAKFRDDLDLIRYHVELEARLIDDLLDLTRIARGKFELQGEALDMHTLLEQALKACRQSDLPAKDLQVRVHPQAAAHHVWADPARLQQVFWNLLKNAVKFTPDGGRITIRTLNPRPGRVAIEISDTGIGIAPARLPHIFQAFEQGDRTITRTFGGLGLGLTICKALVEAHGGTITASSAGQGRGATFTVELTTIEAPASAPDAAPPEPLTPWRSLAILLVEDHASTARVMSRLLERMGHTVQTAGSLSDALAAIASEEFDLVVSDLALPDGSGLDLMRQIKQRQPELKGLALSGYGMEQDIRESLEAGFARHLTKPVSSRTLEAALAVMFDNQRAVAGEPS